MFKFFLMFILISIELPVFGFEYANLVKVSEHELNTGIDLDRKLLEAARTGMFYLEIPILSKPLIPRAVQFAGCFYTQRELKELCLEGFSGYQDRDNSQVEALYIEREYWEKHLPKDLSKLAKETHSLALQVLTRILPLFGISKNDLGKITGNVTEGKGDVFFTFNHYQPEKNFEGLASHRDFGQMTILFTDKPGLQVKIDEHWMDVQPIEGYYIVNFGKALEKSVNDSMQLTAAWHRVKKVTEDRTSFAIAIGNAGDSLIYKKNKKGDVVTDGEPYLSVIKASKRYKEK